MLCTITSDMATFDANTVAADPETKHNRTVPSRLIGLAKDNVSRYQRQVVEGVELQGIGSTTVALTFITQNRALRRLRGEEVVVINSEFL